MIQIMEGRNVTCFCFVSVMMPVFQSHDSNRDGSSLVGVVDFDEDDASWSPVEGSGKEPGCMGGVCWRSDDVYPV